MSSNYERDKTLPSMRAVSTVRIKETASFEKPTKRTKLKDLPFLSSYSFVNPDQIDETEK